MRNEKPTVRNRKPTVRKTKASVRSEKNGKTGRHTGLPVRIWANLRIRPRKGAIDDWKNVCRGKSAYLPSRKDFRGIKAGNGENRQTHRSACAFPPSEKMQLMIGKIFALSRMKIILWYFSFNS